MPDFGVEIVFDSGSHSAVAGAAERGCWLVEGGRRQIFEVGEEFVSLGLAGCSSVADYKMVV